METAEAFSRSSQKSPCIGRRRVVPQGFVMVDDPEHQSRSQIRKGLEYSVIVLR